MTTNVRLTDEEVLAVRRAIFAVRQSPSVATEIGDDLLKEIDTKIEAAFTKRLCGHCGEETSDRRHGLCSRCNSYERKYGKLPSDATLAKRAKREHKATLGPASARPRMSTRRRRNKPPSRS